MHLKIKLSLIPTLAIAIVLALLLAVSPPSKAEQFPARFYDVSGDHWAYAEINDLADAGIMIGVAKNYFAPNDSISRAMFVTALYRLNGSPEVTKEPPFFSDVTNKNSYYYDAVQWAYEEELALGINANELIFAPAVTLTREQMVLILHRMYSDENSDIVTLDELRKLFTDADELSSNQESPRAFGWAVAHGMIQGYPNKTLQPHNMVTRAEGAAILDWLLEK
jgi:minor extracellular protease Epr